MNKIKSISFIIPCYNEKKEVLLNTISEIENSIKNVNLKYEIIVVDDGSNINYEGIDFKEQIRVIRHKKNSGYGYALKTGIKHSTYNWIGITDADGTYPNDKFSELIQFGEKSDMVIGARDWGDISLLRKYPKLLLTKLASFIAECPIPDLNSGMRIFKKSLCYKFWHLYPAGFSFTSTLTIGAITNDEDVYFHNIDYFKREGESYISPIRDTIRFFSLVIRLALYFNPKRFFLPLSFLLFLIALLRGTRDYIIEGSLGGLSLILFFIVFQVFFFGLLAEIINKTRQYIVSINQNVDSPHND